MYRIFDKTTAEYTARTYATLDDARAAHGEACCARDAGSDELEIHGAGIAYYWTAYADGDGVAYEEHTRQTGEPHLPRNYATPRVDPEWASSRETHLAVATAIHAIADSKRSPDAIWTAPTAAEWDHVRMAVEEYIAKGDYAAEPDGRYSWGQETVKL